MSKTDIALKLENLKLNLISPIQSISGYLEMINKKRLLEFADFVEGDFLKIEETISKLSISLDGILDEALKSQNTESKQIEKKIRHDFRNPLNVIIGYSEMILEDLEDIDELKDQISLFSSILKETKNLNDELPILMKLNQSDFAQDLTNEEDVKKILSLIEDNKHDEEMLLRGVFLVVDDNQSNREFLKQFLLRQGHKVLTAENGIEALDLLNSNEVDVVLLDMIMPKMNGYETLVSIKSNKKFKRVRVIMVSGLQEQELVIKCIEAGADDYLNKPFNSTLLKARIKSSLEKKSFHDKEDHALVLGRKVQESLIPNKNQLPEFISAINIPARSISGDFYDVLGINDKTFGILADVAGKGVHAGMVMTEAASIFRHIVKNDPEVSPDKIVQAINESLSSHTINGIFLTAVVFEIDQTNISFINCGHEPILFFENDQFSEISSSAPPIGIVSIMDNLETKRIKINQGQKFLIMTDGVTEGYLRDGSRLGVGKVKETMQNLQGPKMIEYIQSQLIYDDSQSLHDDITVMCIDF